MFSSSNIPFSVIVDSRYLRIVPHIPKLRNWETLSFTFDALYKILLGIFYGFGAFLALIDEEAVGSWN